MSSNPTDAKSALIAELLGDIHTLIESLNIARLGLEVCDENTQATVKSLEAATLAYQQQLDLLVTRLRAEMSAIVMKSTDSVATSIMSKQISYLTQAARESFKLVLNEEARKTRWRELGAVAFVSSASSLLVCLLVVAAFK